MDFMERCSFIDYNDLIRKKDIKDDKKKQVYHFF